MEDCARLAENLARESSILEFNLSLRICCYKAGAIVYSQRYGKENMKAQGRLDGTGTIHSEATKLPDFGAKTWSNIVEKSGAITIGARDILVAYNVNVNEPNAVVAKKLARL